MKEIRKILVPTDFSEGAVPAYTHAQEIAGRFGSTVDFIHVIPTLRYFGESLSRMGAPLDMENDLYPHAQEEAQHRLGSLMDDYIHEDNRGEAVVRIDRKPSEAIAEYAGDHGYDLVVMATHGKHETEMLRGSVTEKVIRHSPVPVFTVDQRLSPGGLKHILYPTDGSSASWEALPLALAVADTYDAEITFFHVTELYGSLAEKVTQNPNLPDEVNIYEGLLDSLEDYLIDRGMDSVDLQRGEVDFEDRLVVTEGAGSHAIPARTEIRKGVSAHYAIEEYAGEYADLVVMATHGHSGLAHFFLGSTTEKVAQHVDKPVLTVRSVRREDT
ncbi:MAG: universal stress protein [Balneolaceae bacterium]|nr:universal stress protein [Balneolaceae bacterium]